MKDSSSPCSGLPVVAETEYGGWCCVDTLKNGLKGRERKRVNNVECGIELKVKVNMPYDIDRVKKNGFIE